MPVSLIMRGMTRGGFGAVYYIPEKMRLNFEKNYIKIKLSEPS